MIHVSFSNAIRGKRSQFHWNVSWIYIWISRISGCNLVQVQFLLFWLPRLHPVVLSLNSRFQIPCLTIKCCLHITITWLLRVSITRIPARNCPGLSESITIFLSTLTDRFDTRQSSSHAIWGRRRWTRVNPAPDLIISCRIGLSNLASHSLIGLSIDPNPSSLYFM